MKTKSIEINLSKNNNWFPKNNYSFGINISVSLNAGIIKNIPYEINMEGKMIIVYEDFLEYNWIQIKKDNESSVSSRKEFDYNEIDFIEDSTSFLEFHDNSFKYAIVYKLKNDKFIPINICPFYYKKGIVYNNTLIDDIVKHRWVSPLENYITINNITHLSFDEDINSSDNEKDLEFSTFCGRYYNSIISNLKFDKIEYSYLGDIVSSLKLKELEKVITCECCLKNISAYLTKSNHLNLKL